MGGYSRAELFTFQFSCGDLIVTKNSAILNKCAPNQPTYFSEVSQLTSHNMQKPDQNEQPSSPTVAIIAYSGRALAQAASMAGCKSVVFDQFGDVDTLASCSEHHFVSFDRQQSCLVQQLQKHQITLSSCDAILIGGGCENQPAAVQFLASFGKVSQSLPTPTQLNQLRSVEGWQAAANASGVRFPKTEWVRPSIAVASQAPWLRKSRRGAGGVHVRQIDASDHSSEMPHSYWQQMVLGDCLGVHLVAERDGCRVLGATLALTADQWYGPLPFIYRGSWGPISLTPKQVSQILRLGEWYRSTTGIRGWLQLDFVRSPDGQLWLLDVNPRWTAGMEVFSGGGASVLAEHLQATRGWQLKLDGSLRASCCSLKSVLYASEQLASRKEQQSRLWEALRRQLALAATGENLLEVSDVPAWLLQSDGQPESVRAGEPLVSLVVRLATPHEPTLVDLQRALAMMRSVVQDDASR